MVGGVGNGAAEEDWHWDLNTGTAAILGFLGTTQIWGAPFLPCGLGSKRDLAGKERGERTLAGRP